MRNHRDREEFAALAGLDLPFAGLSAATKNKIGVVGIATLIMAAAWFLPGMLKSNPYEHITDFPPASAEEGHEGGGEHAKPAAEKPKGGH